MRFTDKIVLVTGSSRGIGKAAALSFAKEGAIVVLNAKKLDDQGITALAEVKKSSAKSIFLACDIAKEEQVTNMFREIKNIFGKLDILVNNAGIVHDIPFMKKTSRHWNETLSVNLMGPVFCSKEFIRLRGKSANKGSIVNISSTNGINCFSPDSVDYDISKAGIILLTSNLAIELAPQVRVNCVAPGWVNTEMNKDLPADFVKKESEKIYIKRFAAPQELANVILFLASEEASFINGETIKVDGGYGGWSE